MRKIFFFLAIAIFLIACSEKSKNSNSTTKNNITSSDIIVSADGVGEVKINMSQEDLEKLINNKIPLTNLTDTTSGSWDDSAKIKYRNADLDLVFGRDYYKPDTFRMKVTGVRCNSPLCKTSSGIGIGSDLTSILPDYENNLVTIQPGLYNYFETIKTKTESTLMVRNDSNQRVVRFFMRNDKVIGFETTDHVY